MRQRLARLWSAFASLVERLEEIPIPPGAWCAGFLAIVAVRHLLEIRSGALPLYHPSAFFVHYLLAYLAPLLALTLILALASGVALTRVMRLMLLAWGLTLLPPLVDSLVMRHHGAGIGYMELGRLPWTRVYLRFLDPTFHLEGTTPGIRVETAVACGLGVVYVLLRARGERVVRSLAAAIGIYTVALGFFTLPELFLRSARLFDPSLTLDTLFSSVGRIDRPVEEALRIDQVSHFYLVPLTLILAAAALAVARPGLLEAVIGSLKDSEGGGWAIAVFVGAFAGWRILEGIPRDAAAVPFDRLAWVAGPLALLLGGAALTLFDGSDEAAERRRIERRGAGLALLAAAAILAASISPWFAALGAIALAGGVLARGLARFLPWAFLAPQIAAGIATVAAFLAGFSLCAGAEAVTLMPGALYLIVFLSGALADLPRAFVGEARSLARGAGLAPAIVPLATLAVCAAALPANPSATWLLITVVASASALAVSRVASSRIAAAAALAAGALVLGLSFADPAQAAAWRRQSLAPVAYWLRVSVAAEESGDLARAVGAASEAVKRAPDDPLPHGRLGLTRYRMKEYDGAIEELRIAVILRPDDAGTHINLATVLLGAGRAAEALQAAEDAIRTDPSLPTGYFIRAGSLEALGRTDESERAWREYLHRAEGDPGEASYVAIARQKLGIAP